LGGVALPSRHMRERLSLLPLKGRQNGSRVRLRAIRVGLGLSTKEVRVRGEPSILGAGSEEPVETVGQHLGLDCVFWLLQISVLR